jgi:hypothetical protein
VGEQDTAGTHFIKGADLRSAPFICLIMTTCPWGLRGAGEMRPRALRAPSQHSKARRSSGFTRVSRCVTPAQRHTFGGALCRLVFFVGYAGVFVTRRAVTIFPGQLEELGECRSAGGRHGPGHCVSKRGGSRPRHSSLVSVGPSR